MCLVAVGEKISKARQAFAEKLKQLESQAEAYYSLVKKLGVDPPELRLDTQLISVGEASPTVRSWGHRTRSIAPIANKLRGNPVVKVVSGSEFDDAPGEVLLRGVDQKSQWTQNLNSEFMGWGTSGPGLYFGWKDGFTNAYGFAPDSQVARFKLAPEARVLQQWTSTTLPLELSTADVLSRVRNRVFDTKPSLESSTLTPGRREVRSGEEWNVLALREGYDAVYGVESDLVVLDKSKLIADDRTLPGNAYAKMVDALRLGRTRQEVAEIAQELILQSEPKWASYELTTVDGELLETIRAFVSDGAPRAVQYLESRIVSRMRETVVEALKTDELPKYSTELTSLQRRIASVFGVKIPARPTPETLLVQAARDATVDLDTARRYQQLASRFGQEVDTEVLLPIVREQREVVNRLQRQARLAFRKEFAPKIATGKSLSATEKATVRRIYASVTHD